MRGARRGEERTQRLRQAAVQASVYSRVWRRQGLTWRVAHAAERRQTRNQCQPRADVGCFHSQVYFPTRHPSSTAADGVQLPRLRKGCSAKHRPTCPALSRLAAGWRGERVALSWGSATCDRTTSPQQTALRPRTTQAYDRPPLCISASRLPISFRSHPALLSGTPSSTP